MTQQRALSASNLVFSSGGSTLLGGVDLSLDRGEIVALIGHNGSGKTTLLKGLLGWLSLSSGVVQYATRHGSVQAADANVVGATVGEPAFVSWMTPMGFGKMLLESAGLPDRGQVQRVLTEVDLGRRQRRRRFCKLSQGERSLCALAFALLRNPPILLLDEPFAHLDRGHADHFSTILRTRADDDTAILYTCHSLADLAPADRVVSLSSGQVSGHWAANDPELILALR